MISIYVKPIGNWRCYSLKVINDTRGVGMNAIKRFGSAMIVPVLLFAFSIVVGLATLFKNPDIMGSIT